MLHSLIERINMVSSALEKKEYMPRYPLITSCPTGRSVKLDGLDGNFINFASNNYLGLANHPKIIEIAKKTLNEFGFGSGASRWMAGNSILHRELEERIAEIKGCEDAVIFSTGMLANNGTISAILNPAIYSILLELGIVEPIDVKKVIVFLDEFVHASIYDGVKLSEKFKTLVYRHLDYDHLEVLLKRFPDHDKFCIVDGVFSTNGSICNLPKLIQLKKKYNFLLMVDDAHSFGVLGDRGAGTANYFGIDPKNIDVNMGTFSKSCGGQGGYVAGSREMIKYIKHNSRQYIFNTSTSLVNAAAMIQAIELIKNEPERRIKLQENSQYLRDTFTRNGFDIMGSETQIIPILMGDESIINDMFNIVLENGLFVPTFKYPAAPKGKAVFRISLMATHEREDLERIEEVMLSIGKKFSVI